MSGEADKVRGVAWDGGHDAPLMKGTREGNSL